MRERYKHRITGKIIIQATITNTSPILPGKGAGDASHLEVMLLPDRIPYIPASSLAGCLRSWFGKWIAPDLDDQGKIQAEKFWGSDDTKQKTTFQSHICFSDLKPLEGTESRKKIVIRDGVKIAYNTGIAEEGAKYDYQLVESGVNFGLMAEVTIRNEMEPDYFKSFIGFIKAILSDDDFRLGAFTNTGFGAIESTGFNAKYFDFSENDHRDKWFEYLKTGSLPEVLDITYESKDIRKIKPSSFSINAEFIIRNSLIIGSYGIDAKDPDKSHLKSNNIKHNKMMPVLTGKSIKGALRHRALKILKTLEIPNAEKRLQSLMGWVETDGKSNALKSRLRIEEVIMEGVEEGVIQNRIRIDRFTGGTMNGALFNSLPVWTNEEKEHLTLILTLLDDYEDWEAALLLQLLKDLWTEDLPIGGEKSIGRGILTGKKATITNNNHKITFVRKEKKGGLTFIDGDINNLSPFNKSIRELIENTNPVPI